MEKPFSRSQVSLFIQETGVVPIFYHSDPAFCIEAAKAVYAGGIRLLEFTNRGDFAHEVFAELHRYIKRELPDMLLGVGSVVEAGTASLYMQLGARFVVSPLLNPEMARVCNRRKVLWVPGCATLSEISQAEELGADLVKMFPAGEIGGPSFIKAILGPCPWTSIWVSGSVSPTQENLRVWFDAGAACVGIGSNLFSKEVFQNNDFGLLTQHAQQLVQALRYARTPK